MKLLPEQRPFSRVQSTCAITSPFDFAFAKFLASSCHVLPTFSHWGQLKYKVIYCLFLEKKNSSRFYKLILFFVFCYFFYLLSFIKHDKMRRICNFLWKRTGSEINHSMLVSTNHFTFRESTHKDQGYHTCCDITKHSSLNRLTNMKSCKI